MCLAQDSGQTPDMESLSAMQSQAPGIAKYIRDHLQGDNSVQIYFDFIKALLSAVSGMCVISLLLSNFIFSQYLFS